MTNVPVIVIVVIVVCVKLLALFSTALKVIIKFHKLRNAGTESSDSNSKNLNNI